MFDFYKKEDKSKMMGSGQEENKDEFGVRMEGMEDMDEDDSS